MMAGDMPSADAEERTVERIVANVIVKCRIRTESDVTRRQERFLFYVLTVFDRWADGKKEKRELWLGYGRLNQSQQWVKCF